MSALENPYSVTIVGLGNIGSQTAPAVARIREIGRINLVDPDVYESKNLVTQGITREAVGQAKVDAVAAQLRSLRADLEVRVFAQRVESVPWGRLRADFFLGCLDSKAARRELNRVARRLGGSYVDAGVSAESLRVRVGVFPAAGDVCMECGWSRDVYANLEVPHACQGGTVQAPETNAPAYLGQLAAAIQVQECHRLMLGVGSAEEAGQAYETLLDGQNRKYYHSFFRSNPSCRFRHGRANGELIRARPEELRIVDMLHSGAALEAEGDSFVKDLICPGCQARRPVLLRRRSVRASQPACEACGERLQELGFTMREALIAEDLAGVADELSFADAGFLAGDVFRIFSPEHITNPVLDGYYEFEAEPQI